MRDLVKAFLTREEGAVTVDWVILTGIAVSFGLMVFLTLGSGTNDIGQTMQSSFEDASVAELPQLGYAE